MKNHTAIIIGGTGQFGIILSQLLLKKIQNIYKLYRYNKKIIKLRKEYSRVNFVKLNIYKKNEIKRFK